MYDSSRDREFDQLVEEFEMQEADRIAEILERNADKFQIDEDKEFIITEMGGN